MKGKIFFGLLVSVLLLGCFATNVTWASDSELVYGVHRALTGIDTHGKDSIDASLVVTNVFDPLVIYDYDEEVYRSALATDWDIVDPLTWEFTLREGVTFHDGTPFNSESVKATVELIQKRNGPTRQMFDDIETVETPDEYTAIFRLSQPAGYLLAGLSITGMAPAWAIEDEDRFIQHPIGTGPFEFEEWVPDSHHTLVANENYWMPDAVKLSSIRAVEIPEGTARATALMNGEIDIAHEIDYSDVAAIDATDGLQTSVRLPMRGYRIFINCGINPERGGETPFADPRVREALWYAIDADMLADMYPFAERAGTVMAKGVIGAATLPPYERDVEKARQLLAEAGYPNGFDTSLKVRNLDNVVVEIAEMIAADLQEVGINAELILQTNAVWTADVSPTENNPFDLTLFNHGASLPDPFYILDRMFTQGANRTGYKNDEFDELLREANAQSDPDERLRMYEQAQEMIWGTGPTMFPIEVVDYRALADYVHGFQPELSADFRGVWIEK